MSTDIIRRGQVEVFINGAGIPPITEDTHCMGIDPALVGSSYTVESSVRLNARTYRFLTGQRMPGSIQTTFQYRNAHARRHVHRDKNKHRLKWSRLDWGSYHLGEAGLAAAQLFERAAAELNRLSYEL